ncbi:MAG: cobaltochelatase subunit CobN [Deltaproteobacteria bacterium]|jgi:cobaltochelatase CobN|nr:cobaltochelatase subunit CobN [Deltaproteobacteria bacterium]
MMKITVMLGSIYGSWLRSTRPDFEDVELVVFSGRDILGSLDNVLKELAGDLLFIQDSGERFAEAIQAKLDSWPAEVPWLKLGHDAADWAGNVGRDLMAQAQMYLTEGGPDNGRSFWLFLRALALKTPQLAPAPVKLPHFGIWHPAAPENYYPDLASFGPWLQERGRAKNLAPAVGVLVNRFYWAIAGTEIEDAVIAALEEAGLLVIPVFAAWSEAGARVLPWLEEQFNGSLGPKVEAIVKFTGHFANDGQDTQPTFVGDDSPARAHVRLFRRLNVPIFQPLSSYNQANDQWLANPRGLGLEAAWTMTLTEFEGAVEPFYVGGTDRRQAEEALRQAQPERAARLAQRVARWVKLRRTPPEARKVAFILHNCPCASVEATVGAALGLDAPESLAQVARRMKEAGYQIEPPASGERLMAEILSKKALSEFRWTSAAEIVGSGGALALLEPTVYQKWFQKFPERIQASLVQTWGVPPGETLDEVPPSMVYEGKIIVSGLPLGPNAVVLVQPKRGCAGARCDGRVCRILQDPLIAPPHQYLAVYHWLAEPEGFGADVLIHLGTHGSLEWLPGKSAGLSAECLPDLAIGALPHLYVFEAGATGDGLVAKRRSYATLVNHQPPIYGTLALSEPWAEVAELLEQKNKTPAVERRERLVAMIQEKAKSLGMREKLLTGPFEELELELKRAMGLLVDSLVEDGLRVFGEELTPAQLVKLVAGVLRRASGEELSFRAWLAQKRGWNLVEILTEPNWRDPATGRGSESILPWLDNEVATILTKSVLAAKATGHEIDLIQALPGELTLSVQDPSYLASLQERVVDILNRARACQEMGALLSGLAGQYITPGPSASLWRGRADVLPTGRNFYTQDPRRLPTKLAVEVGAELATLTSQKYLTEEGRWPRSVAFFWISSDLLQNDGEDLAQMLALMGLRPQWSASGLLIGTETIPLSELGRPRIDLTIRVSSIMTDAFGGMVDQLDRAIAKVAALDEAVEDNYVRAHTLENLKKQVNPQSPEAFRRATYRIFGSPPGSSHSGVYLAIMASAWRDEKDLMDIYCQHGSYAYGQGTYGELAPNALNQALARVDLSVAKLSSDSEDFLECGGYFGTQGGLTLASEFVQGRRIRNYCQDGRHPKAIRVRDLKEEINRSVGSRLLNPAWIAGQKKHGYRGAQEIAKRVGHIYGWQATAKVVEPSVFEGVTRTFFLDEANRAFFAKHNPYALEEMGRRLLEAASRKLWLADTDLLEQLKAAYLELEGTLEERTETYGGEIQGGSVDILTADDVNSWKEKMELFQRRSKIAQA